LQLTQNFDHELFKKYAGCCSDSGADFEYSAHGELEFGPEVTEANTITSKQHKSDFSTIMGPPRKTAKTNNAFVMKEPQSGSQDNNIIVATSSLAGPVLSGAVNNCFLGQTIRRNVQEQWEYSR